MTASSKFTHCLLCNSSDIKPLKGYEKNILVKCNICNFIFCQNIPTTDDLIEHYNNYIRSNKISDITIKRYELLLDKFEKYRQTNNIIDVGCGDGFFLQIAKKRGWNVYGTEFTEKAMEVCLAKDINIIKGALDENNYKKGFFDIITSFEVIEHINNPRTEILKFQKILRKNGIVYVTTPNFNSISRYLLRENWNIIEYPEHLSYYTKNTLENLFKDNGFKKITMNSSGISIERFKKVVRQGGAATNVDEGIRQKAESNHLFKIAIKVINFFLNITNKGDALKATFKNCA